MHVCIQAQALKRQARQVDYVAALLFLVQLQIYYMFVALAVIGPTKGCKVKCDWVNFLCKGKSDKGESVFR